MTPAQRTSIATALSLLALGLSGLDAGAPFAQHAVKLAPQTEQPPPSEPPPGPQAIPASQITIKSEETDKVLRSMRERPDPDPEIERIRSGLPVVLGDLQDLLNETENRLKGSVSSRTLEDLERRWSRHNDWIEDRRSTVNRRAQALDRDLETLQALRASWEVTRNGAAEAGLQEALLEVINSAIAEINEVEERFGNRRSEVHTVQGQVAEAKEIARDAQDLMKSARHKTRLKITQLDARPLWEVFADLPPRANHWKQVVSAWQESRRDVREFRKAYRDSIIVHALTLILLILAFWLLKRRTRSIDLEDPELSASARIISRPVSSAATLWLLLTMAWFPQAPQIIDELTTLVLFVPLFRILPSRVVRRIPGLLVALVVVNLLGRFIDLLAYMSPLYRVALLFESVLLLSVVASSTRKTRAVPGDARSVWIRLVRAIQWIALLYLFAATVTNVVGNVSFASTVTRAVYLSGYLGLAFYAIYYVAAGVIHLALRSRFLRHLKMVRRHEPLLRRRFLTVLLAALLFYWFVATLQLLQMRDRIDDILTRILTASLNFGQVGLSLGGVLSFVLTVWAAILLSRLIRFVLSEDVYPRLTLPRGVTTAVSIGVHYALLLLGFFLAVAATGADLGKTTILAGAFGVGVGFGLQDVVNNFVSGLILVVERPILVGDTVQIDTLYGEVKRIGLRSSTVRTWEGAEVIVPNGKLISSQVVNWTLSDRQRRLDVPVGVEYGTDPDEVVDILVRTGSKHPGLMETPAPMALFLGFGEYTLDFQLRVWTAEVGFLKIKSELAIAVNRALNDAGIVIPVPKRDLTVKTVGPTPQERS